MALQTLAEAPSTRPESPSRTGVWPGAAPGAAPSPSAVQLGKILAGMIGRGHGLEAICFFLQLTREALLDLAVLHDLPTPHGRPRRNRGGARAWTAADYTMLIGCWLANWRAASIGEHLGRSQGSIWYQARRLGLPRRDRKSLVKPAGAECHGDRSAGAPDWRIAAVAGPTATSAREAGVDATARAAAIIGTKVGQSEAEGAASSRSRTTPAVTRAWGTAAPAADLRPRAWLVRNAVTPVWVRLKANRDEIDWDLALDDEVANRCWAYQHPAAAARDFGISLRAFTSRHSRLELPPRWELGARLVEHYDPSVIAANIAEHGFVKRQCLTLKGWWFWGKRSSAARRSKRSKLVEQRAAARTYAGATASTALSRDEFSFVS